MKEPVILKSVHTPFACRGGAFHEVHPDAPLALKVVCTGHGMPPATIVERT